MPPRNVVPKPRQKPHPPIWVACSRRDTIHLAAQKGIGALDLRLHRPRRGQALGERLLQHLRERVRPDRRRRQPERGLRHDVHVRADRGARPSRRGHRGRQLLRLLARPLLPLRPAPAGPDRRVGRVRGAAGRAGLRPRGRPPGRGQPRPAGCQGRRTGGGRPAGRRRHARPAPRIPAPLRGVRRRPGHLREPGRASNRHEDIMESLELFGREVLPEFAERDERREKPRRRRVSPRSSRGSWPASPPPTTRRCPLPDY